LGGVEDKDVYPVRGQTVLRWAPWVKEGRSLVSESGSKTYIIPRRGGTVGLLWCSVLFFIIITCLLQVIVGGTRVADDWYAPKTLGLV